MNRITTPRATLLSISSLLIGWLLVQAYLPLPRPSMVAALRGAGVDSSSAYLSGEFLMHCAAIPRSL